MYLTGWAESPVSAYVKKHGVSLMLLMQLMYLCLRGKRYKGEQPLKEQNKVRFLACITLRHPI